MVVLDTDVWSPGNAGQMPVDGCRSVALGVYRILQGTDDQHLPARLPIDFSHCHCHSRPYLVFVYAERLWARRTSPKPVLRVPYLVEGCSAEVT